MAEVIDRDNTSSPGSPMNGGRAAASEGDDSGRSPLAPAGHGWLLQETRERKLVKHLWRLWNQWDDEAASWHAQWKANRWRRKGMTGVVIQRATDDRAPSVYAPPNSVRVAPSFNMAARLCRQLRSNVWADPPVPEAIPGQAADDDAENAAQVAGRWLRAVDSTPPVELLDRMGAAFDLASTYDSGFLLFEVDPKGGGHRFVTVEAGQGATTEADATHVEQPDPATGEMVMVPRPGPFVQRYVAEDGTLTDDPELAKIEWLAAIRPHPLTPYSVRPVSKGAIDVQSAPGVLVARYQALGELRKKYPAINELTFKELRRIVDYDPDDHLRYLPHGVRSRRRLVPEDLAEGHGRYADIGSDDPVSIAGQLRAAAAEQGLDEDIGANVEEDERDPRDIPDDIDVFTLCLYMGGHTEGHRWGAEVCIAGDEKAGRVVYRAELAGAKDGRKEVLPIPVSQVKQFREGLLDFYGVGAMTLLGSGNEARATMVASMVEHLDRFNRRKVFYSPNSLFQPKAANGAMGTYIPVADGTEPKSEIVPEYPRSGVEMFSLATTEMQDDIGLAPVAQGKTDPSVKSALHAATIVEQVVVNLSDVRQASERFILQSWRIMLALAWAKFDRAQILSFFGEDNEYKAEDFLGADLGTTRDVRLAKSSFTMLAPSAKLQVAEYALGLGIIDHEEMRRIFGGNYGADLGVQDSPALLRVRRQINEFWKGPPADWVPPQPVMQPQVDPATGQPMLDEMGQPVMAPAVDPATGAPQMQPPSSTPFERIPYDLEPPLMTPLTAGSEMQGSAGKQAGIPPSPLGGAAMLRSRELARALASARYDRMRARAPEWAQLLWDEYEAMRQAAGIATIAEQQQAMQAQMAAQQQAEQAAAEAEQQGRQQELEAKEAEGQLKLAGAEQELELDRARAELELEHTARRGELDIKIAEWKAEQQARAARATNGNGARR